MRTMVKIMAIIFISVFTVTEMNMHHDTDIPESEEVVNKKIVELEPKPVIPPKPQREKISLPRNGVTNPGATVYELRNDCMVRTGKLNASYFNCLVMKEIISEGKVYYLVRLRHFNVRADMYIVAADGVHILKKNESTEHHSKLMDAWRRSL